MKGYSKHHQLNQARAIYKYNVCKKVSQLNKVIQLFLAQVSENQYHMLIISNKYEKLINQILQNHSNAIISLQKEANKLKTEVNTNLSQEYINKITEIEKDYNEEVNSLNFSICSLTNETENLTQSFNEIKTNKIKQIDQLMVNFNKIATDQFNDLQVKIKKLKNDHFLELNNFDDESQLKIKNLQIESEENFKKLNDQHLRELEKIQNENFIKIGIDPNLQIQIRTQKSQILQLKENFQKYVNNFHKNLFECRSKMNELMNYYSSDLIAYKKALNSLENKNNQEFQSMINEENQIKNLIDQKSIQFEKELNERQNELTALLQSLNNEFIEKTNSLKNDAYLVNSSINEMILKLAKEKDELISQQEIEKKLKIEVKLKNLININQQEDCQFISTKKNLEDSLQKLKEDHFSEKALILSTYQEMTEKEIKHFSEEMMKLRQSIQSISSNGNALLFQNKQKISDLQKEKDEVDLNFKKNVLRYNEEKGQEIDKSNKRHISEIEELENSHTVLMNSLLNKNECLIKENEEAFKLKKVLIQEKYEKERVELFQKIQKEYCESSEKELNQIKQKYSSLYDQQSVLLSKIDPPSSSSLFSQLTNEANDLSIKRAELFRTISIKRKEINQKFEDEINSEINRHDEFLNDLRNTGRKNGRDTLRQSLHMQINNVKNEKEEERKKYCSLLDEIEFNHNQKINQLSIDLNREKDLLDSTENELKSKLSLEKINCNNEIDFAQNIFQQDKLSFQNEINLFQKDYETKINDLIERNDFIIRQFEKENNDLINKLSQVKINENDERDQIKRNYTFHLSSLKNNHEKTINEMKDLLAETSASIARLSISNRIE